MKPSPRPLNLVRRACAALVLPFALLTLAAGAAESGQGVAPAHVGMRAMHAAPPPASLPHARQGAAWAGRGAVARYPAFAPRAFAHAGQWRGARARRGDGVLTQGMVFTGGGRRFMRARPFAEGPAVLSLEHSNGEGRGRAYWRRRGHEARGWAYRAEGAARPFDGPSVITVGGGASAPAAGPLVIVVERADCRRPAHRRRR